MNKQNTNEFSKLIDKSFDNVSRDVRNITENNEKVGKKVITLNKTIKDDIEKVNKDITFLKISINNIKNLIAELDKKVKRNNNSSQPSKPINHKEDIKELKNELTDIKLSIKNIENKLKMN
jgi:signal recognition particle subunit SEC65